MPLTTFATKVIACAIEVVAHRLQVSSLTSDVAARAPFFRSFPSSANRIRPSFLRPLSGFPRRLSSFRRRRFGSGKSRSRCRVLAPVSREMVSEDEILSRGDEVAASGARDCFYRFARSVLRFRRLVLRFWRSHPRLQRSVPRFIISTLNDGVATRGLRDGI